MCGSGRDGSLANCGNGKRKEARRSWEWKGREERVEGYGGKSGRRAERKRRSEKEVEEIEIKERGREERVEVC